MDKTYIGVDPGETTGLFITGPEACGWMQPKEWDGVKVFRHYLQTFKPAVVVIEQFNVMEKRTALAGSDIQWPLDIIGAVKWECMQVAWPMSVVGQWNYERRKITNDMLQERGWFATPATKMRHANDAARHVLKYILNEERRNR